MNEREQIAYLRERLSDPWWRLDNLYKIENEKGQLVTFKMRPAQRSLFEAMYYRNIVLKARQIGFSTAIDIYLLDQALFHNNLKCGIIAQDKQAAGEMFRTKIAVPFDNLPGWLRSTFKIAERRSGANGGYLLFAHGSSLQVATSFRSGTVQRLHISEHGKICAKYPTKAKEVRTGTLNTVHEGCVVFIESTAEGVGGDFHTMSARAMELAQSGLGLTPQDYKFHFFAWWQDPKYQAPVPVGGLRLSQYHQAYFTAVEQAMGITLLDEQRQWYIRKEIEQQEEMKQEFPSTPSEAFLTSGRRVFSALSVMTAEAQCKSPLLIYDMEPVTGKRTKVQSLRSGNINELQRTLLNYLLVWELPDLDEDYAIGGDVAEGLENRDRSSMDVVKKSTGEQVAHWFGYLDADLFAQLLAHVGRWYNTAFIGPERNNHGHAVLQKLREVYPHRLIYSEQYLDRDHDDETPKLGWLTTAQSKPVIIESLKTLLREHVSGIRWIGTLNELNTYVYDARGRMSAQTDCFDDQVMSYAIAQEMRARMPGRSTHTPLDRSSPKHWMTL
ncbi:terminase [Yersinia alsatica]|uniref:terminase n=1 Tax=Yersinia alsatica TaxID=2890317 RepID=UPI0032EF4968